MPEPAPLRITHSKLKPRPRSAGQWKNARLFVLMYGSISFSKSTNGICGQSRPEEGNCSRLSPVYMVIVTPNCLRFERQLARRAFSLARARAGSNIAARIAMMAMTTSNSIRVKPDPAAAWPRLETGLSILKATARSYELFDELQTLSPPFQPTLSARLLLEPEASSRRAVVAVMWIGEDVCEFP